jgi:hypothetical protein
MGKRRLAFVCWATAGLCLANDPRSLLEQARTERAQFRRTDAIRHLSEAFSLAPDDPAVLREYAAATPESSLEPALLRRLIGLETTPRDWRNEALARLAVRTRLGDRVVNRLVSEYVPYRLPMKILRSAESRSTGWILPLRINGSRPLRLLLDTGSRGMLISQDLAESLRLEPLGTALLDGFGDERSHRGQVTLAKHVAVGAFQAGDVMVESVDRGFSDDLDGLVGTDLFRHFRITLNGPEKMLELSPFEDADPSEGGGERPWSRHAAAAPPDGSLRLAGHLLLAPVRFGGERTNFVIDSGAAFSLIQERDAFIPLRMVTLTGLSGTLAAPQLPRPLRVEIAGSPAVLRDVVASDLSGIGAHFGVPIEGFIGFPLLNRAVTSLDLRSGSLSLK